MCAPAGIISLSLDVRTHEACKDGHDGVNEDDQNAKGSGGWHLAEQLFRGFGADVAAKPAEGIGDNGEDDQTVDCDVKEEIFV